MRSEIGPLASVTLVLLVSPNDVFVRILALPALVVATGAGLFLGARLGSRVPVMTRTGRGAFGGAVGASIGAAVGGSVWLSVVVTGQDFPHGLAAFVKGGIVGALIGLLLGVTLASAEARAESP